MALALDATSTGQDVTGTVSTITIPHTCTGSNLILCVAVSASTSGSTDNINIPTYNGVSMAKLGSQANSGGNKVLDLFCLLAPSTGTNNIVISTTGNTVIQADGVSFTGALQSTPTIKTGSTATGTTGANTLTSTENNSIHIVGFAVDAFAITSVTNGTLVSKALAYSNPLLISPAASNTMTGNSGGSNNWATYGAILSQAAGVSPSASLSPSASVSPSASISPSASRSPSSSSSASLSPSSSISASISPSASRSPSSSISASISPSASVSPSASISPSNSVSASISPSASVSPSGSASPSSSTSPSLSPSASVSPSSSRSASMSPSGSSSPSPSLNYALYSRGDYSVLPTTNADLKTIYTVDEENKVAQEDNILVGQQAQVAYMIHQFKSFVGSNTFIEFEYVGKSTLATELSTVYFQVYNVVSGQWETIALDNSHEEDIDFEIQAKLVNAGNYKDSDNVITARIYQLAI